MKMIHIAKAPKAQAVQMKKVKQNQKDIKTDKKTVSFKKQLVQSDKKVSQKTSLLKDIPLLKEKSAIPKKGNIKINSKLSIKPSESKLKGVKAKKSDELNTSIAGSLQVKENIETKETVKKGEVNQEKKVESSLVKSGEKQTKANNQISNLLAGTNAKVNIKQKKSFEARTEEKPQPKIKVKDLRSKNKAEKITLDRVENQNSNLNIQNQEAVKPEETIEVNSEKTISLGTTEISAEGEGGKSQAPVMKEASSLIKQQLKEFGNNEIVKQSRFILKDKNVGEIKLILKPESLGEVKINLNLNDSNLTGQIVVDNSIAKEVFEDNMPSLSKALEEKGFNTANLDVSLSDKEKNNHRQNGKNKQYFSERLKKFESNGQVIRYGLPTAGINLTA